MTVYSLGLDDRDRVNQAFGGGFPAGRLVLVEGADGAGKSVLSQRFAYGMVTEGACVTYVSTESSAAGFVDQMASLAYDVVDHLLDERLLFLSADLDTHDTGDGETVPRRHLLSRLTDAPTPWRADVVFVDGFDSLLRNDPAFDATAAAGDEDHAVQSFLSFLDRVLAGGRSVVLTVNPEGTTDRALRPLRNAAGVYLDLQTKTVGQEIRSAAVVRRFSDMREPVDDTVGFAVQQGRGVVIQSRTVA